MSIEELKKHKTPNYSKGEEIFNMVSHIVGGALGVIILIISIIFSFTNKLSINVLISLIIYAISVITLYTMSSVYHGLRKNKLSKKVMQIIDHCTIYFLIAGTYTPICITTLTVVPSGLAILLLQWLLAAFGITINAIALNKKIVVITSMILYIALGWMIIFFPTAISLLPQLSFIFILFGGIAYTIGSILYGFGAKRKWFHSIFHLFCLLGTILQAIGIFILL